MEGSQARYEVTLVFKKVGTTVRQTVGTWASEETVGFQRGRI